MAHGDITTFGWLNAQLHHAISEGPSSTFSHYGLDPDVCLLGKERGVRSAGRTTKKPASWRGGF